MPDLLFSEFGSSNKDTWKKQVEKELKKIYNDAGKWEISRNLPLNPYYTAEDIDIEKAVDLQNCQKKIPGWINMPVIRPDEPWQTNSRIKSMLASGADAIILDLAEAGMVKSELSKTLHSIRLSETPFFFQTTINPESLFKEISQGAGYYLKGGMFNDPLANWMRTGSDFEDAIERVGALLKKTKMMREFRPLMIESHVFHNAGADPVQELAFLLASTAHYIDQLTDAGISPLYALNRFFYSVSIGPDYLTEIAKLRALRFLYRNISRAYRMPDELCQVFIHAQTSSFHDSALSPHTNMVRATCEAMSAVTGGCDGLTVQAFDHSFTETTTFSEGIASNVSLLLAHESYLGRVADPAAGAYQLEIMSSKIAAAAWDLFLKTEEKGGIISCFKDGFIQSEIESSWSRKMNALQAGKVMVGVNKFKTEEKPILSPQIPILENETAGLRTLPVRNLSAAFQRMQGI
jgi:methylmalonyl-CoA mutase